MAPIGCPPARACPLALVATLPKIPRPAPPRPPRLFAPVGNQVFETLDATFRHINEPAARPALQTVLWLMAEASRQGYADSMGRMVSLGAEGWGRYHGARAWHHQLAPHSAGRHQTCRRSWGGPRRSHSLALSRPPPAPLARRSTRAACASISRMMRGCAPTPPRCCATTSRCS